MGMRGIEPNGVASLREGRRSTSQVDIMVQSYFFGKGVFISSIAAGPIFVAAYGGATLYAMLPQTIPIDPSSFTNDPTGSLWGLCLLGSLVIGFGFILAIVPNTIGGGIMSETGLRSEFARLPFVWLLVGSGTAGVPVVLVYALQGTAGPLGAALIITSGLCALIVRRYTRWVEAETEEAPIRAPASVSPPAQSELGHRNTGARLLD
jgi:hypothetical protein